MTDLLINMLIVTTILYAVVGVLALHTDLPVCEMAQQEVRHET